ncbi:MAG: hypothetical protein Q9172_001518 [Xanthocarpia lactea]
MVSKRSYRTDDEVDRYWRAIVTEEPVSYELQTLIRADLERTWYFHRINSFHFEVRLHWAGTDSERLVLADSIGRLTTTELKYLCNKPTAVYCLQSAQYAGCAAENIFIPGLIFGGIFQEWLRYHHKEPLIEFGHFFANPVRITPSGPKTVQGVIDAHLALSAQAAHLFRQVGEPNDSSSSHHYILSPLYHAIVVIIDSRWIPTREDDGLISLQKFAQNQTALIARTGVEEGLSAPISLKGLEAFAHPLDLSDATSQHVDVIRVSLAAAVHFISDLETKEDLANGKTKQDAHHQRGFDPPTPRRFEDGLPAAHNVDDWVDAVMAAAEKYGYDNISETWQSIRRVQASLVGEEFDKLEHWPEEQRWRY